MDPSVSVSSVLSEHGFHRFHEAKSQSRRHESNKYNFALLRGRHPTSFAKTSELWNYMCVQQMSETFILSNVALRSHCSTDRLHKVGIGQQLWNVADQYQNRNMRNMDRLLTASKSTSSIIRPATVHGSTRSEHNQSTYRAEFTSIRPSTTLPSVSSTRTDRTNKRTLSRKLHTIAKTSNSAEEEAAETAPVGSGPPPLVSQHTGMTAAALAHEFSTVPDARVHYGCTVAFELVSSAVTTSTSVDGNFLMVCV